MCLAPTFLRGSQPLTRRCPLGGRCRFPPAAFEKFTVIFGFHACDGRGPGRGVSALSRFGPSGRKRVHVGAPPPRPRLGAPGRRTPSRPTRPLPSLGLRLARAGGSLAIRAPQAPLSLQSFFCRGVRSDNCYWCIFRVTDSVFCCLRSAGEPIW